jgi:ABC-type glycerol-3-phosphate transport system substrate-binding protein
MKPRSPKTKSRGYWLSSEDFVIIEESKKRGNFEAAAKAAKVWFDDPIQKLIAERLPTLPSMVKWFKSDVFLKPPPVNREVVHKSYEDMANHIVFGNGYRKGWSQWVNAYRSELDKAFNGETPPREALTKAIEAGDKVFANVR